MANPPQLPHNQGLHQAVGPKPPVPNPTGVSAGCSLSFLLSCSVLRGRKSFQSQGCSFPQPLPSPRALSSPLQGDKEWMLLGDTGGRIFHPFKEKCHPILGELWCSKGLGAVRCVWDRALGCQVSSLQGHGHENICAPTRECGLTKPGGR